MDVSLLISTDEVIPLKCWRYDEKSKDEKDNCPNCHHWDGVRCKDEAELLAEWERKHGGFDRMMRGNRGVNINV
jgi:hypothetical protein